MEGAKEGFREGALLMEGAKEGRREGAVLIEGALEGIRDGALVTGADVVGFWDGTGVGASETVMVGLSDRSGAGAVVGDAVESSDVGESVSGMSTMGISVAFDGATVSGVGSASETVGLAVFVVVSVVGSAVATTVSEEVGLSVAGTSVAFVGAGLGGSLGATLVGPGVVILLEAASDSAVALADADNAPFAVGDAEGTADGPIEAALSERVGN